MLEATNPREEEGRRKPTRFLLLLLLVAGIALAAGWNLGARFDYGEPGAVSQPKAGEIVPLDLGEIIFPIRRGKSIRYLVASIRLEVEQEDPTARTRRLIDPLREIALVSLSEIAARTTLDRIESRKETFQESLIRDMNRAFGSDRVKALELTAFNLRDLQP